MSDTNRRDLILRLGPLDAATAAWMLDLCGHLQQAIWSTYGEEIEAHWAATEPDQLIYGHLPPADTDVVAEGSAASARHKSRAGGPKP